MNFPDELREFLEDLTAVMVPILKGLLITFSIILSIIITYWVSFLFFIFLDEYQNPMALPPSTRKDTPVMYSAASEDKNTAALPIC
jgi:hypothetical protein